MSIVTSAARPSAPSAAAANEVAIEKKTTVPPSAVARIAPCSQPGTSTQTTVTSAGPPARGDRGGQRHRVAGVGDDDGVGEARPPRSSAASAAVGTTPIVRPGAGAPGRCQRQTPALAGRAEDGHHRRAAAAGRRTDARRSARGRRTRPDGHGQRGRQVVRAARRRWTGRTARRARRPGPARCARPTRASPSVISSGVSVSDTSVATGSPTRRPERRLRADLLDRPRRASRRSR